MILLFGGTSETAELAERIARMGHEVLVSTATDISLDVGSSPNIRRRTGLLDRDEMTRLVETCGIKAVVDITHPYAVNARANARKAARAAGKRYITFIRPSPEYEYEKLGFAKDHDSAAEMAFGYGSPVLLMTGSRNLKQYTRQSIRTGVKVVARVLDHHDSINACREAGIPDHLIIAERGPFTVEQNIAHITMHGIKTVVTKESGAAGAVAEKIEAARQTSCRVVMVERPETDNQGAYTDMEKLLESLREIMKTASAKKTP
ncbi:Cobalt-precorrin-6A reductase [hydrothermal vent metagenome]|uniref:Cobalt-precorrin-6A reductase n=1 Tax=hydrothermal vent metagenome TaxID=652676 RepID=A0A3B1D2K6_9ZZZZ